MRGVCDFISRINLMLFRWTTSEDDVMSFELSEIVSEGNCFFMLIQLRLQEPNELIDLRN